MRRLRWLWPLVLMAVLLMLPWLVYGLHGEQRLQLVIVDKTVPFADRVEHRGLFWLLDHLKIRKPDGTRYDVARDYVGVFPGRIPGDPPARTTVLTPPLLAGADMVYLADTYGVYEGDLASGLKMEAALERSPRIHGGLQTDEARAVAGALTAGTTVVAEFNTLASPTGAQAREFLEALLGVRWTRWVGRYFVALEDEREVPAWVRENYEREWGDPWEFNGPGWVLLQDDLHVEVLRAGIETRDEGLVVQREKPVDPLLAGVADDVPYRYWFDVVRLAGAGDDAGPAAGKPAEILASYQWRLTPAGRERLRERALPLRFPAVVRRSHARAESFYFAGDFIDTRLSQRRVPFAGYPTLMRWLEGARLNAADPAFYWRFYVPLMQQLLAEHAS